MIDQTCLRRYNASIFTEKGGLRSPIHQGEQVLNNVAPKNFRMDCPATA